MAGCDPVLFPKRGSGGRSGQRFGSAAGAAPIRYGPGQGALHLSAHPPRYFKTRPGDAASHPWFAACSAVQSLSWGGW